MAQSLEQMCHLKHAHLFSSQHKQNYLLIAQHAPLSHFQKTKWASQQYIS